jgi:hypothetical protein
VREGSVEGVATDDLVEVRGGDGVWRYEGIKALDDELGALKAEHWGDDELGGGMVGEDSKGEVLETHDVGVGVNAVWKTQWKGGCDMVCSLLCPGTFSCACLPVRTPMFVVGRISIWCLLVMYRWGLGS